MRKLHALLRFALLILPNRINPPTTNKRLLYLTLPYLTYIAAKKYLPTLQVGGAPKGSLDALFSKQAGKAGQGRARQGGAGGAGAMD